MKGKLSKLINDARDMGTDSIFYGNGTTIESYFSLEIWLELDITEEQCKLYPLAKKAAKLKKTKLFKALK